MAGESIRFNASLNTAGFDSGAARLQQVAGQASSKVSASFASMGASIARVIAPFVGLYAAINSVKNALDLGGRLNDLSKTTGETAGNLAVLQRAFDNTGVGADRVGTAIQGMSNFISDLQTNSPAAAKAAAALGISMDDLANKTQVERMRIFLDALNGIQDPATRSALAVDVFKKAGRDIVPLAKDFGGAMAEAQGELGSLPRILDENAASLDDLGDKLTNAVGSKLTELAVGLTAGATGAKDLATALGNIDAAGFGEKLGSSIRAAFAAPEEYAKAIGEFLLAGVLKAANALDAAMKHAVNVYYEMMDNPGFWNGLFAFVEAGFAKVGAAFTSLLADGLKTILSAMDWNPLWKPFTALAKGALDEITDGINDASIAASNQMEQGATQMKAAWNNATASSKYVYEDTFGAEQHLQKAADHMERAHQAAAAMKDNSAAVAENLATGSSALSDALDKMRGFDLGGGEGEPFKLGYKGSENFPTSAGQGGGGAVGGLGPSVSGAPMSQNMRVADLRGAARQSVRDQRASQLAANGMFRSAIRAQDAGQRAYDRAMDNANLRDLASQYDFAGREAGNVGEALSSFRDQHGMGYLDKLRETPGYDRDKGEMDNFKNYLRESAKTPEERKQEEEAARSRSRPPGGGGDGPGQDPANQTAGKLDKIINIMEERLPIRVIAA
jgi:hypothetical protein